MIDSTSVPRWQRRLDEFTRMLALFERTAAIQRERPLTEAEEGGLIQFFEMSVELGWKTLASRLRHDGVDLPNASPINIIREAAKLEYIGDPDRWLAAIERRNIMSHTYDPDAFSALISDAAPSFLPMLARLRDEFATDASR